VVMGKMRASGLERRLQMGRLGRNAIGMAAAILMQAAGAAAQTQKPPATPKPTATQNVTTSPGQTPPGQTQLGPAEAKIPLAQIVWTVQLDASAGTPLQTGSVFASQRSAVIAGDRVVAIFPSQPEISRGGRPVVSYRMVSLDLTTGRVKVDKQVEGQSLPYLFATDDGHIDYGRSSLIRVNPDLSETGDRFAETEGRISAISPDGSTLAHWSEQGTEIVNADSLSASGGLIRGPEPAAVSKSMLLIDDLRWAGEFPQDFSFVVLLDRNRPHLLYHGKCGGRPEFLADDKLLFIGCGKATIMDTAGKVLKEIALAGGHGWFAGVSRDGSRFALVASEYPTADPSYEAGALITVYDAASFEPLATVATEPGSGKRPWTAFAQDGHLFLSGDPDKLTLYRIP